MAHFIGKRDKSTFDLIYKKYYAEVFRYLVWTSKDIELSKDLTQSVFVKVYTNPQHFNLSKDFKIWLLTIARNLWKNELRSKEVARKYSRQSAMTLNSEADEFIEKEQQKTIQLVYQKMTQLNEHHREVIAMKYSNNLSINEISKILDCSEGTVKSRLFYAIKKLKELLQ